MAIEVEQHSFCSGCPDFDPEALKMYIDDGTITWCRCAHYNMCARVENRVRKAVEEENRAYQESVDDAKEYDNG